MLSIHCYRLAVYKSSTIRWLQEQRAAILLNLRSAISCMLSESFLSVSHCDEFNAAMAHLYMKNMSYFLLSCLKEEAWMIMKKSINQN